MPMSDAATLLSKVQERIREKDAVIADQLDQIAELEDKLEALKTEVEALKAENAGLLKIKEEFEAMKRQLDELDSILEE